MPPATPPAGPPDDRPPGEGLPGEGLPARPREVAPRPLAALAALLGVTAAGGEELDPFAGPGVVTGVTHDSRQVRPGDLYAALPGSRHHGALFCREAAAAGATAVLTDADGRDLATASALPALVVSDVRARLGEVASWVYGKPSERLLLIGVTGTSGKTTTTYLLEAGLRRAGHVTGLVGGVQVRAGGLTAPGQLSTTEATVLHALFSVMA